VYAIIYTVSSTRPPPSLYVSSQIRFDSQPEYPGDRIRIGYRDEVTISGNIITQEFRSASILDPYKKAVYAFDFNNNKLYVTITLNPSGISIGTDVPIVLVKQ
jgi:hypothetical protein